MKRSLPTLGFFIIQSNKQRNISKVFKFCDPHHWHWKIDLLPLWLSNMKIHPLSSRHISQRHSVKWSLLLHSGFLYFKRQTTRRFNCCPCSGFYILYISSLGTGQLNPFSLWPLNTGNSSWKCQAKTFSVNVIPLNSPLNLIMEICIPAKFIILGVLPGKLLHQPRKGLLK